MATCVIYGDRTSARDRLAGHLATVYDDIDCVGSVGELLDRTRAECPDVLVVDTDTGDAWLEVLRRVRHAHPALAVMVVGAVDDGVEREPRDEPAARALRLGARGYLRGGELSDPDGTVTAADVVVPERTAELSAREMDVLRGMTEGRSNAEIAAELVLAEDTVKTHARRLFRKLGAGDRADAVARGFRQGLLR